MLKHQQVQLLEAASILVGMNETSANFQHDRHYANSTLASKRSRRYSTMDASLFNANHFTSSNHSHEESESHQRKALRAYLVPQYSSLGLPRRESISQRQSVINASKPYIDTLVLTSDEDE